MSLLVRRALVRSAGPVSCVLMLALPPAGAQTIADYSRAQSAWLESTMSQAAARSAALGASAPAPIATASLPPSAPAPRLALPAATPAIQVSGVFASAAGAVAEVLVNATAYLLAVGQGVPGTTWRVETIAIDKVVLARRSGPVPSDGAGASKSFSLPALY